MTKRQWELLQSLLLYARNNYHAGEGGFEHTLSEIDQLVVDLDPHGRYDAADAEKVAKLTVQFMGEFRSVYMAVPESVIMEQIEKPVNSRADFNEIVNILSAAGEPTSIRDDDDVDVVLVHDDQDFRTLWEDFLEQFEDDD